jgi:hypothetical protein
VQDGHVANSFMGPPPDDEDFETERTLVEKRGMNTTSETTMMQRYVEAWLRKEAEVAFASERAAAFAAHSGGLTMPP